MSSLLSADLAMLPTASAYDLGRRGERKRSTGDLTRLFRQITSAIKPEATLEIGARQADFSNRIRTDLPTARAYAFEANPHNVERFSPALVAKGVRYLHIAASDVDGQTSFLLQRRRGDRDIDPNTGTNSLLARAEAGVDYERVTVDAVRMDTFLRREGITGPVVAWIDVEGALGKVMPGWGQAIGQLQAAFLEVEDTAYWEGQWTWPDVFDFFDRNGLIPIARDYQSVTQHNIIVVRESAWPAVRSLMPRWISRIHAGRPPVQAVAVTAS